MVEPKGGALLGRVSHIPNLFPPSRQISRPQVTGHFSVADNHLTVARSIANGPEKTSRYIRSVAPRNTGQIIADRSGGPVVRVSPSELEFNTAGAWEDIYGLHTKQPNMPKDPVHAGAVQAVGGVVTMQYEPSDASHGRQRRALAHAFSIKALAEQEQLVAFHCMKLVHAVARFSQDDHDFDLSDWFNYLTFDITGDLTFKEYYGCLDKGG